METEECTLFSGACLVGCKDSINQGGRDATTRGGDRGGGQGPGPPYGPQIFIGNLNFD